MSRDSASAPQRAESSPPLFPVTIDGSRATRSVVGVDAATARITPNRAAITPREIGSPDPFGPTGMVNVALIIDIMLGLPPGVMMFLHLSQCLGRGER